MYRLSLVTVGAAAVRSPVLPCNGLQCQTTITHLWKHKTPILYPLQKPDSTERYTEAVHLFTIHYTKSDLTIQLSDYEIYV